MLRNIVQVLCDCGCGAYANATNGQSFPDAWIHIQRVVGGVGKKNEGREFHFSSLKCLRAWTKLIEMGLTPDVTAELPPAQPRETISEREPINANLHRTTKAK